MPQGWNRGRRRTVMLRRSATWTALLCACLSASTAMAEKLPLNAEAQTHFEAGLGYVDDPSGPKWEDAFNEFRLAYKASPTPKLLNNIGVCALNLERDGEAIEAFKAYLAAGGEKDLKPKQRKQIETDIATLSASLVKITLNTVPEAVTIIDKRENAKGETLRNIYQVKGGSAVLGLHPGRHRITAEAEGYAPAEWVVDAAPASSHSRNFELTPEKKPADAGMPAQAPPTSPSQSFNLNSQAKPERRTPTSVYIGLAATGVFAGAATAAGIIALGQSKDLDKIADAKQAEDKKSDVKTWALLSDIGTGAAVLSAGITAYLYFSAPKANVEKIGEFRGVQFAPVVAPNVAGGAVFGRF